MGYMGCEDYADSASELVETIRKIAYDEDIEFSEALKIYELSVISNTDYYLNQIRRELNALRNGEKGDLE